MTSPFGGDAELCATDGKSDPHYDEQAFAEPSRTLTTWPVGAGTLEPGSLLSDRYRVMELLGVGGMSRLYLAEQIGLGRPVALKTIYREFLDDPQSMSSFLQEARVLARVNHPNIVSVYGVGETALGERYIAMEYVPGETLADLMQHEGALPLRRAVSILLQLARALGAVHREGVIHRDMKPDNVLLLQTSTGIDVVKVADFGLAKVVSRKARHEDDSDEHVLGTPEYMSPEQIRAHGVDHRSDIYSLGCIAYELLTGKPPFTGRRLEVLHAHLHDRTPRLDDELRDAPIPPAFQQVIERALAKDPKHRFGSAFEVYASLLQAADTAGIPRRELRLVESLFDDPAYTIVHEGNREVDTTSAMPVEARPDAWLRGLVLALCLLAVGVAFGRWTVSPNTRPTSALAPASTTRIVVPDPAGEFVMLDRTDVWKKVPTSFDGLTPGEHQLHFGRPRAIRTTVPVHVDPGKAFVVRLPDQ